MCVLCSNGGTDSGSEEQTNGCDVLSYPSKYLEQLGCEGTQLSIEPFVK